MLNKINIALQKLDEESKSKPIKVISHYDTDGITAAAIFTRALQRWKKEFSLQIVKGLEESFIQSLPEDQILVFLDLASNSLNSLKNKKTSVFIFDHHEVIQEIPENVTMINPVLEKHEPISGAGIAYLFAKTISSQNTDLANLAVIGMVGDVLEKNITKTYSEILKDSETIIKKGLLIYPSTRPIDKALEYSSYPFIPGVSGSYKGALNLLKEANIQRVNGVYKSLNELTEQESENLITSIMIRCANEKIINDFIGNIFLVKFFNRSEDARELSALINACSRMGHPSVALGLCLGNKKCKEESEKIYIEYKQNLFSALRYIEESEKINGNKYTIIHGKDVIKDTIIGTVASIISNSTTYEEGTIIIALAYNQDKIKVSARLVGKEGRNLREVLNQIVVPLGGEVGGHPKAAGCLISKEKESEFIQNLKKTLESELVKV